ncbi:S-layer homology domain-containing protein [Cohnella cellulosilytica]|uniref:S-layer homology domain-containing protein n=1 Tax=Cohnella cellulosilytica TaxID=986710 RepID=A0ABW2F1U9_9BACL
MIRAFPSIRSFMRLALAFVVLCAGVSSWGGAAPAYAAFADGNGLPGSPYLIKTREQLDDMRDYPSAHFQLEADIDLAGFPWEPVGTYALPFSGTFDGNGYTISSLVNDSPTANYVGLFGMTAEATIRNVGLIGANVQGVQYVGGLVGYARGTRIENVYVTGSVNGSDQVGGLSGYMVGIPDAGSVLREAYSAASVHSSGGSNYGAIAGSYDGEVSFFANYYDSSLTAVSSIGTGYETSQMKNAATFSVWNINEPYSSWAIFEGVTYPIPRAAYERLLLGSLELEAGGAAVGLEPAFSGDRREYAARLPGDASDITVTAEAWDGASLVRIGGDETSEKTIGLNPGANEIFVDAVSDVVLPGTSIKPFVVAYKLNVAREDGSPLYPHRIGEALQLAAIGTGAYEPDDRYELTNDLDLSGLDWTPIGSAAEPFAGEFDGGRHVVRNLTVSGAGRDDAGLFGVSSGTIRSLGLENVSVSGGSRVGALLGTNGGTVENVYALGAVSGTEGVGGLIGFNGSGGSVANVYYAGTVDGAAGVGGVFGADSTGSAASAYWDAELGGEASGGGEGKTTAEMKRRSTFAGWDFAGVWAMTNEATYPMWKERLDAAKATAVVVTPERGTADWGVGFASDQGRYAVELNCYVGTVDVGVALSDPGASAAINGAAGLSVPQTVHPGANEVKIEVRDTYGHAGAVYELIVRVPAPALVGVAAPEDGYYVAGDALTFTAEYEGAVVVNGSPRLALDIGGETKYADYAGQPPGEANKLRFVYTVEDDLADSDGIELLPAIELPADAGIAASGEAAELSFAAPDTSGIQVDSRPPAIVLSQTPAAGVRTTGPVTVTAVVTDETSGIAETKWASGSHPASFFGAGGDALSADGFEAAANGVYTVYARDAAGNEAVAEIAIANIRAPGSSGGSGGGSGPVGPEPGGCSDEGCLFLRAGEAGTLQLDGLTVEIPAGATNEDMTVTGEIVPTSALPSLARTSGLLSSVFELQKTGDGPFLKPVTIRMKYRVEAMAGDVRPAVFFFDEAKREWVEVGGTIAAGGELSAQVDHFTKFAVLAVSTRIDVRSRFADVERHWAGESIAEAAEKGLVGGYPDGTFRPDKPVTRAEFAVMLANGLGWTKPSESRLVFADDKAAPPWARAALATASGSGVLAGYPDGTLRPNEPVTRAEMAAMIARALHLPPGPAGDAGFRDDAAIPDWAKPAVNAVLREGIVSGDEKRQFRPWAATTRAEAAVILLRALDQD